jgi:hypothetical protein
MKKVLLALAIVGFAVACNNSSESTAAKVDSAANAVVDSAATKAKAVVDSAAAKADSTVKAVVDSAKK